MTAMIRTELVKLRTIRSTWAFVAAFVLLEMTSLALVIRNAGRLGAPSVGTTEQTLAVLGAGGRATLLLLILGVIMVTGEYRHSTITGVFLVRPDRRSSVAAKAATVVLIGLVAAVASVVIALAVGLVAGALDLTALNSEITVSLIGLLLGLPAYGLLGVGVGALVKNQTAAVILPLVWFVVIEALIPAYGLRALVPWTPTGAALALSHNPGMPDLLPAWAGGLLLYGYAIALVASGYTRMSREDIT
jgi:ABC-2 type transport system permease protein